MSLVNRLNDGGQTDLWYSEAPSVAVIAGFGSGKTHAAWTKLLHWFDKWPHIPNGYFAPTYSLIRDIFVPVATEFCAERNIRCDFKKSENKFYMQGFAPIYCRSMNEPANIVGFEIGNAVVDEGDILTTEKMWEAWRKIKARCRIKLYEKGKKKKDKNQVQNQMALASTPEGFKFAFQAFKNKKTRLDNAALYQMSTYSNIKNLPVGYIEELMTNYPPELIKAYINGEFTNLTSGTVYTSYDRELNHAPGIKPLKKEVLYIGMDFNVGRMVAIIHVVRNGLPIACGEIVNKRDTPDMIFALRALYPQNPMIIYPDASGDSRDTRNASQSDLKLLKQAGLRVKVNNKNPFVKDRILSMNGMFLNAFGQRRYLVNYDECPVYADCLEQQCYDKNGVPDKDSDLDHAPDAGGYFIHTEYGINKPESRVRKLIM